MAKFALKEKAFSLRKEGKSIAEIAHILSLSKSTVSLWCKEIKLTKLQREVLYHKMVEMGHRGRLLGALTNRRKKEVSVTSAQKWASDLFGSMSERDFLFAGVALYWGEGSKADGGHLSFVNSDSAMVLFMYKWFQVFFQVSPEDFIPRIYINEIHRPRIEEILNFWSNLLELPRSSFRGTIFIKTSQKKIYSNHSTYYGLLSLRVRRSSVLKYKLLALVDLMRNAGVAQVVRASHS